MKYSGYDKITVHNDRFNPNDEMDICLKHYGCKPITLLIMIPCQ